MVRAALTGHLVFSTLHTNDAISAVPRLTDLGIPPYLLSSCLLGLSAQRLGRRLCPVCREAYTLSPQEWAGLGGGSVEGPVELFRAVGCHACSDNGYNGRISLAEIIRVGPGLRNLIDTHQPTSVLKQYLKKQGVPLMRQDGLAKAQAGLTTVEEVGRVIQLESDMETADAGI
jgi:type II secretory ATPase GspE/PulE/Tfp pilus assembly ATPase PilB-like protein